MSFPYAICTDPGSRKDCATCRHNPDNQPEPTGERQKPDLTDTGCRSWEAEADR